MNAIIDQQLQAIPLHPRLEALDPSEITPRELTTARVMDLVSLLQEPGPNSETTA
jgi:hypothetical protein